CLGVRPNGRDARPPMPAAIARLTLVCGLYKVKQRAYPGLAVGHAARIPMVPLRTGLAELACPLAVAVAGQTASSAGMVSVAPASARAARRITEMFISFVSLSAGGSRLRADAVGAEYGFGNRVGGGVAGREPERHIHAGRRAERHQVLAVADCRERRRVPEPAVVVGHLSVRVGDCRLRRQLDVAYGDRDLLLARRSDSAQPEPVHLVVQREHGRDRAVAGHVAVGSEADP